jgi:hypothetical protein
MPNWPAKTCAYPIFDRLAEGSPMLNWLAKNHVYPMLIGWLSAMVLHTQLAGHELCLPHVNSLAEVHSSLCPTGQPRTVLIPCLMGWLSVAVLYTQLAGQELCLPHADSLAEVHGSLCPTGWPRPEPISCLISWPKALPIPTGWSRTFTPC